MAVVEIEELTKDYEIGAFVKKKRRALDHLNLQIEQGEIFGLIGPNGAGKTTTLKLIMNLIFPTEGAVRILGRSASDVRLKAEIGYLPENPKFYDYLTGRELFNYFGQLFGMGRDERRKRSADLFRRVDLHDAADLQLRKYSKGMLQRLGIAQAILNRPKILFLDEPMSGLDPMGRRDMTLLIHELREEGTTIVFSSHILPDVESLCDQVAILNQGKLVCKGRLSEILDLSLRAIEIVVDDPPEELSRALAPLARKLNRLGKRLKVELDGEQGLGETLDLISRHQAGLLSVHRVKQTLEDYFIREVEGRREGTV